MQICKKSMVNCSLSLASRLCDWFCVSSKEIAAAEAPKWATLDILHREREIFLFSDLKKNGNQRKLTKNGIDLQEDLADEEDEEEPVEETEKGSDEDREDAPPAPEDSEGEHSSSGGSPVPQNKDNVRRRPKKID